jgi:hypothetical protein
MLINRCGGAVIRFQRRLFYRDEVATVPGLGVRRVGE